MVANDATIGMITIVLTPMLQPGLSHAQVTTPRHGTALLHTGVKRHRNHLRASRAPHISGYSDHGRAAPPAILNTASEALLIASGASVPSAA